MRNYKKIVTSISIISALAAVAGIGVYFLLPACDCDGEGSLRRTMYIILSASVVSLAMALLAHVFDKQGRPSQ